MTKTQPVMLDDHELRQKINLETARLGWSELQRHFARGIVVVVGPELDLIEVAAALAEDQAPRFEHWVKLGQLHRACDEDGRRWDTTRTLFWSCVVAPWVLVQEIPLQ